MAGCPKVRFEVLLSGVLVDEMFSKADELWILTDGIFQMNAITSDR